MSDEKNIAAALQSAEGVKAEHAEFIANRVVERLRWPTGGGPATVVNARTRQAEPNLTPADVLADLRRTFPFAFGAVPVNASSPSPANGLRFAPSTLTAKAITERDARAASAKAEADTVNPFAPATRNHTLAAVMERDDPARAARLRSEAGA